MPESESPGRRTVRDEVAAIRSAAGGGQPAGRRGFWVSFLSPYGLEVALDTRPDWVALDLQHGDLDIAGVSSLLRVTEPRGIPVLARMPSHDGAQIARVVDAGVDGVIVPGVESAAEAELLVDAIRLPPQGRRSTGTARSALGVTSGSDPLLLPMVETRAGFDAAVSIAQVEGVDGIFVGPYDLSVSLGIESASSADGLGAVRAAIESGRSAGVLVGMYAGSPELRALAPLVDLIALDSDMTALRLGLQKLFG